MAQVVAWVCDVVVYDSGRGCVPDGEASLWASLAMLRGLGACWWGVCGIVAIVA